MGGFAIIAFAYRTARIFSQMESFSDGCNEENDDKFEDASDTMIFDNSCISNDTKELNYSLPENFTKKLKIDDTNETSSTYLNTDLNETNKIDDAEEEFNDIIIDDDYIIAQENQLSDEVLKERQLNSQNLKDEGNTLFRDGKYDESILKYTDALEICPRKFPIERSVLYSNRGACRLYLKQFDEGIDDSTKALDLNPNYLKALLRRAQMYEQNEKLDEALADYTKCLELDPNLHQARAACMRLPDQIKERNEKMKEEMMSKLKDLGNMVLKPFGLSTNNFQMTQNPETGSYSINFQQNSR